jgi:hypothetical protein
MNVWNRLWEIIVEIFTPVSGHWLREGLRLMAASCAYLLVAAVVWEAVYKLVATLQTLYIPIPQPVGLLLLLLGIPYFVIWFIFGKKFGSHLDAKPFLYGLLIGIIGIIPDTAYVIYVYTQLVKYSYATELERISIIILSVFCIILPIMSMLGTVDGFNNIKKTSHHI